MCIFILEFYLNPHAKIKNMAYCQKLIIISKKYGDIMAQVPADVGCLNEE